MTNPDSVPENFRCSITLSDQKLAQRCARGRIVIIDDDTEILAAFKALLELEDYACEIYSSALEYLQVLNYNRPCFPGPCCLLCDVRMPELDGLELQSRLAELDETPLVLMSGVSGAHEAACAFRAGALDFLIKPIEAETLLAAVAKALAESVARQLKRRRSTDLAARIATLTERERQVATYVANGQINQHIADKLGIALRTVKLHRQRALEKLGAANTADLVRIVDEGVL